MTSHSDSSQVLLKVDHLKKHFLVKRSLFGKSLVTVKAVDGVSFTVTKGETFGIVGESGCGKSTLGRTILRLSEPTEGSIEIFGENFLTASGEKLRSLRRNVQMIFQDPYSSLDPRMQVGHILAEPFDIHGIPNNQDRQKKIQNLMELVGMKPSDLHRYPHEFSGGQKQRICIARALALEPSLIICDEPVSALDVSIQAQILNLMKDLQERFSLTYIFISHDLSVIEHICDRVAVMYLGRIVELAPRDFLFHNPQHPYTKALLQAVPHLGQGKRRIKKSLSGEVPSPLNPPSGCTFHPRCEKAQKQCEEKIPELQQHQPELPEVSCFYPNLLP
jgi:oligopeptide transport system ATP-binding protein